MRTFPAEIIVCDPNGTILEMSDTAIRLYQKEGGAAMIGKDIFKHHKEPFRSQVQRIVNRRKPFIYTVEQAGKNKLINISPWYLSGGDYAGFVLFVLDLPARMAHLVKNQS